MNLKLSSTYYPTGNTMESCSIKSNFTTRDKFSHGNNDTQLENNSPSNSLKENFFLYQTTVKFPPKNSLRQILSQITGSEEFILERFNLMKEYFDSVNLNEGLNFNKAFLQIYRHLQAEKTTEINSCHNISAPVLKARKLQPKMLDREDIYIVV